MTPVSRALLTTTSLVNLLVNLVFPVLAVRALGAGTNADALFIVFILPQLVVVLLGNSVLNWLTPRLVRREGDDSRRSLCWSLLWVLLAAILVLCALLWMLAYLLLGDRAAGDPYGLAAAILPIGLSAIFGAVAAALAQSLYTAERHVLAGEWRTLVANAVALAAWFAIAPSTLVACALLFAFRPLATAAILLPRLGRPCAPDRADRDLREILRESRLLLVAATYYKSEPFVDRLLFATASPGAVAAYHLAMQVIGTVTQMMQRVVVAPMIAPYAEAVHSADIPRMRRIIRSATAVMLAAGIAWWAIFGIAGEPLVALLFRNATTAHVDPALIAHMLVILGGYMSALLLGFVSAQVYYCGGETRRVVVLSTLAFTLGIAIRVVALYWWGITGLVAAVSIAWVLNVGLFYAGIPGIFRRTQARGPVTDP